MQSVTEEMVEELARQVLRLRQEWEFHTFWLGTRVKGPVDPEEAIAYKRELNRRVALRVLEAADGLDARLEHPDAHITLHPAEMEVEIRVKPLLIYGRYLKFSRDIPHMKWPCKRCRGRGCAHCGGTGRMFETSVEELVAGPLLAASRATGTKMISMGREDVDARTLGTGRPFILHLENPRVRTLDLAPIQDKINRTCAGRVGVRDLMFADESLRESLVSANPDKSYRAVVVCLSPAERSKVLRLGEISGLTIEQETPRRVLHRRANKLRIRAIRNCEIEVGPEERVERFVITLRVQGGTYIKEFVSGDEGRTRPSVAGMLGVPCDCTELDVIAVHWDVPEDAAESRMKPDDGEARTEDEKRELETEN